MTILNVTITGADDETNPDQLAHFSRLYPFVEWGILFSEKRRGSPRYPTLAWIRNLEDLAMARPCVKLAMHLCGAEARIVTAGASEFNPGPAWRRVQLNGYEVTTASREWIPRSNFSWILQARSEATLRAAIDDASVSSAHVLYDPSGGEGKDPKAWPEMPVVTSSEESAIHCGFAGGIGPENVSDVLREVIVRNPNVFRIWIDMESGVRTKVPGFDTFDLDKVKTVLDVVAVARRKLRGEKERAT